MHVVLALLLCLVAVPSFADEAITFKRASVVANPAQAPSAGISVIITNAGPDDKIVSARSTAATTTVLESTKVVANGALLAQPAKSIDIPGNGKSTTLNTASDYINLKGLVAELKVGSKIPLIVQFEKAGEKTLDVEVVTLEDFVKRFTPEMIGSNLEKARLAYESTDSASNEGWAKRLRNKLRQLGRGELKMEDGKAAEAAAAIAASAKTVAPRTMTGPMSTPGGPVVDVPVNAAPTPSPYVIKQNDDGKIIVDKSNAPVAPKPVVVPPDTRKLELPGAPAPQ
jgi:hypothetical protein